MNRRSFLQAMIGGISAAAAVRTFPFRVFSFPTDIQIVKAIPTGKRFTRVYDPRCPKRLITIRDSFYGSVAPISEVRTPMYDVPEAFIFIP